MKIKATIMVTLKAIVSSWKQVLLMFAIFPLVMAVIMGNFQKSTYKPDIDMDKINIKIVDDDNSKTSNDFKALFEMENMKDIFSISDKEDYVMTIPKGYEDNLANLKENKIKVDENKRVSKINEIIIRAVIDEYGKSLTETMVISNKIGESSIADKEKLFNEISNNINKLSQETALKTNMIKGERILTSFENQATSMITLIMFMIIMGCIGAYNLDKSNGSFKRLISTPMTKIKYIWFYIRKGF